MPAETAADRAAMLDTDEFAVAATYNGGAIVNGIFDNEYAGVLDGAGAPVESTRPVFYCRTADVASAVHGDTLVISGTTYNVVGVEPDGAGMTTLILEVQ